LSVRNPVTAGAFYPAEFEACKAQLRACIPESPPTGIDTANLAGGVVPHAGWVYSGPVAGQVFAALSRTGRFTTYVLFGAAHRRIRSDSVLYAAGLWRTPLGEIEIDEALAERLRSSCEHLIVDEQAHLAEHSLEVQVPFLQHLSPEVRIVPILVAPSDRAVEIGRQIGRAVATDRQDVAFIGSSDLTHYGPRYGFTPHGTGEEGLRWAREVNDVSMIERLLAMQAESIVSQASGKGNACGAGALAATVAACRECGARRGILLDHRTSADAEVTRGGSFGRPVDDAVGYAAVVFC